jgi:nicotinamide-nucleotide adenylyltransferase
MAKKLTGVYLGRFNPVHRGHMAQIVGCTKLVENLIVAVGSADRRDEKKNPFSGAERVKMIRAYIKEEGLDDSRISVVTLKNHGGSFEQSVLNLREICGESAVLFIDEDSPLTKMAAKRFKTMPLPFKERIWGISSTKIRDAIANDGKWEAFTGQSVARLIKRFRGVKRIKAAYAREAEKEK